jgi:hypothetical protein
VLAGILILAALSSSLLEGLLIGFTYVVGMVFPLFVIALVWEKYQGKKVKSLEGKVVSLKLFGREFSAHTSKLVAGLMFLVMGVVNIVLGLTGTMIPAPGSILIEKMQGQLQRTLLTTFSTLSLAPVTLIGIIALALLIVLVITLHFWRGRSGRESERHA